MTVQAYTPAIVSGILTVPSVMAWLWQTDRQVEAAQVDVGGGIRLSTYVTGPSSHGWWATVILIIVIFMIFLMAVFSYLFLLGVHPQFWGAPAPASWLVPIIAGYAAAAGLALLGRHLLAREKSTVWSPPTQILLAVALLLIAWTMDFYSWDLHGIDPEESAQQAMVMAMITLNGLLAMLILMMSLYLAARVSRGIMTRPRNTTFDVVVLFILYSAAQGIVSAALTRLVPGAG
ncbi:MAG: hypothetical protein LOX97_12290 [Sphingomonas sp.]|nr:hypothetical protein [Sphingomonas sp.]